MGLGKIRYNKYKILQKKKQINYNKYCTLYNVGKFLQSKNM